MARQKGQRISHRHLEVMPFAKEPLKSIYVGQRLLTTLLLVPYWVLKYIILPRSSRPRSSWSIKQIISVNFTRRIYKVTELAGVTWGTRNPEEECDNRTLKETRFEWVDPVPEEFRSGIIVDDQVPFKRVGAFIWPKVKPAGKSAPHGISGPNSMAALIDAPELGGDASRQPVIGIFLHGGGYCHMSAHEKSPTSRIPRRLMKDNAFTEIYAVEYRLLQHAPFPAAVQDAASVYTHIVHHYQRQPSRDKPNSSKDAEIASPPLSNTVDCQGSGGLLTVDYGPDRLREEKEADAMKTRVAEAVQNKACKIILIGDSAGGNLVLALARWIRDEGILPPADGLLLLSPSCDPSHAFPDTPSSYVPRPHARTDYLVDTPEPRALLQRTFLGHNSLETMHSPYVSPASLKVLRAFYGEIFAASIEDLTCRELDSRLREDIRNMISVPATPVPETPGICGLEASPTSLKRPVIASPRGLSLFSEFPKACVVLGDAERLEREAMRLVGAMERDGVEVGTIWVEDGVHDVLMMGWWDEKVRDKVWEKVDTWVERVTA